jgi:hypothetical protein
MKKTPWPLVSKGSILTELPLRPAKLVPTFAGRGCCVVNATVPCGTYSWFPRQEPLLFQVAPQLSSRGWVDRVPDPPLLWNAGSVRNRTRDLWICSQGPWPLDLRGGPTYPTTRPLYTNSHITVIISSIVSTQALTWFVIVEVQSAVPSTATPLAVLDATCACGVDDLFDSAVSRSVHITGLRSKPMLSFGDDTGLLNGTLTGSLVLTLCILSTLCTCVCVSYGTPNKRYRFSYTVLTAWGLYRKCNVSDGCGLSC